jgi:hypothetical protein
MANPTAAHPRTAWHYVWAFGGHVGSVLVALGTVIAGWLEPPQAGWVAATGLLVVTYGLAFVWGFRGPVARWGVPLALWALALGGAYGLFSVLFVQQPQPRHLPNLFWMYTLCHLLLCEAALWWHLRRRPAPTAQSH